MFQPPRIFIIEDEPIMAECLARAARIAIEKLFASMQGDNAGNAGYYNNPSRCEINIFPNAIFAMSALSRQLPDLILLDILLDGPDGFTFLNELMSYPDTVKIPIILASSLDLSRQDLTDYGVVGILNKDTMTPQEISDLVHRALLPKSALENRGISLAPSFNKTLKVKREDVE